MLPAIFLSLSSSVSAIGQPACEASAYSPWLVQTGYRDKIQKPVPLWMVFAVRAERRASAIDRLRDTPTREINRREAERLSGDPVLKFAHPRLPQYSPAALKKRLRPYLVRAVYPVAHPRVEVGWAGTRLIVRTTGMGCVPFTEQPLVIWLRATPRTVVTWASADL